MMDEENSPHMMKAKWYRRRWLLHYPGCCLVTGGALFVSMAIFSDSKPPLVIALVVIPFAAIVGGAMALPFATMAEWIALRQRGNPLPYFGAALVIGMIAFAIGPSLSFFGPVLVGALAGAGFFYWMLRRNPFPTMRPPSIDSRIFD